MSAGPPRRVEPGTGWPEDPATAATPVASTAAEVAALAASAGTLGELTARQSVCTACPRLVDWREHIAVTKRRAYAGERYWGRPIPGWGDDRPGVLVVGLAPAAHGGNRTGRVFTGDRSGDFLFASLYRCGLAASPHSVIAGDGQRLISARMVAAVRCAPPDNKPTPAERDTCAPWLETELAMVMDSMRAIVCLGGFAWQAIWPSLAALGFAIPRPRPAFGHGAEVLLHHTGIPASPAPDAPAPGAGILAWPVPDAPASSGGSTAGPAPDISASSGGITAGPAPHFPASGIGVTARPVPDAPAPAAGPAPDVPVPGIGMTAGPVPDVLAPGAGPGPDHRGAAANTRPHPSAQPADPAPVLLLGCYHPSQQNTFTGRVTPGMLDDVFIRARAQIGR